MTNNYAQATFELLQNNQPVDLVLRNLQQTMAVRGHAGLYGAVLTAVVVLLERDETKKHASITVASKEAETSTDVKNALSSLDATGATAVTTIDPTIIGGSIVTYKNQQVDQSYKSALKHLYQSITTN